jgi:hypothetical protein
MIPIREITTNEEFIESRRSKDFKGTYSPEEVAWHNKQARLHAVTLSHAYQAQLRKGFPKLEAFEQALDNWRAYER